MVASRLPACCRKPNLHLIVGTYLLPPTSAPGSVASRLPACCRRPNHLHLTVGTYLRRKLSPTNLFSTYKALEAKSVSNRQCARGIVASPIVCLAPASGCLCCPSPCIISSAAAVRPGHRGKQLHRLLGARERLPGGCLLLCPSPCISYRPLRCVRGIVASPIVVCSAPTC